MICLTSLLDFLHGCARWLKGLNMLVLASSLPPDLFANPRYSPVPAAIKATTTEVHHSDDLHMVERHGTLLDMCYSSQTDSHCCV